MRLLARRGEGSRETERRPTARRPARVDVSVSRALRLVDPFARPYRQEVLWYVVALTVGAAAGLLVALMASNL